MAYAYVKTTKNGGNLATLSFTCTTGNLLILHTSTSAGGGGPTVTSVVDNNAVSWTSAVATFNAGDNTFHTLFYIPNVGASTTSITVTYTGGKPGTCDMWIDEYSGIATTSPLTASSGNPQHAPGTGTDALTSGTAQSVGTVPALLYGCSLDAGTATAINVGTGFTSRYNTGGRRVEDKRLVSTGSYQTTFTAVTGTNFFGTFMASFSEPVVAGGEKREVVVLTGGMRDMTGGMS